MNAQEDVLENQEDADMFPELNCFATLQEKISAERSAAKMTSQNAGYDDRIELSSDDYAAALATGPIVVSSDSDKGGSSLTPTDVELSADELAALVSGVGNDASEEPVVANTTPQLVVSNVDTNANVEVLQRGILNDEQETATADDNEGETEGNESDEEKKKIEKEKKDTSRNNRNFQRKMMNVKNDVEKIQEMYGGDSEYILLIKDNVTKSNGSAGRECQTAGRILVSGKGEVFQSFSAGNLKYNPKSMMVLEEGKKLKSKNEQFMLDWVRMKGLLPPESHAEQPQSQSQSPHQAIHQTPHQAQQLIHYAQQLPTQIQILPLAFNSAILSSATSSPEQNMAKAAAAAASVTPLPSSVAEKVSSTPVQRSQRKKRRKLKKNIPSNDFEVEDSSDIPYEDTSDDDSVLDGMEKAIEAINQRRADARAKKSRIEIVEPAPVDTSSDESVGNGCEQRGAGATIAKQKPKQTKAAAARKKTVSKNDILTKPVQKKTDQNANAVKVRKDLLKPLPKPLPKPKKVMPKAAAATKEVEDILAHAKAIKPKESTAVGKRKSRLAQHQIRDLLDSPKAGPSTSQDTTPMRIRKH
jgi:hypothetical protein